MTFYIRRRRKKRKAVFITLMVFIIVGLILAASGSFFLNMNPVNSSIFRDIQELKDALSPYMIDQATDPEIGNLSYSDGLQWIVEKDGYRFTVFAYTFASDDDALHYRNVYREGAIVTASAKLNTTYWPERTEYMARYGLNALYIAGEGHNSTVDFLNWLENHLTIKSSDILNYIPNTYL